MEHTINLKQEIEQEWNNLQEKISVKNNIEQKDLIFLLLVSMLEEESI